MPDLVLGNSASYDGNTNNAAGLASALGAEYATASNGALTLNRVMFDNTGSTLNVERKGSTDLGPTGGQTISSNTEGPVEINEGGLFGTVVTINSGVYLYSDDRTQPALKLNVPATVSNSGYIIGAGGRGSDRGASNHSSGGPAIEIASSVSGVTVTNSSGAYIAGGGGGGVGGSLAGGGGGAGGGLGGNGSRGGSLSGRVSGAGGLPGQKGAAPVEGKDSGGRHPAQCGGAGGNGSPWYDTGGDSGGAGGRMLPGLAVPGGYAYVGHGGGTGGGGGQAGGLTTGPFDPSTGNNLGARTGGYAGGGGGGWGSSGESGSSGGKAVEDNGNSYTLSNSGTIYGGT
jgi:hypothetical protein